jgi:uncharacterized cupin superfamily protein
MNAPPPAKPTAAELRQRLIRNFNEVPLGEHTERAPLYDAKSARLGTGTAAKQMGCTVDVVQPGKRGCPYHLHHVQEELFVVIEGEGTLRVAGEMLPIKTGDVIFIPAGPEYPHQIVNTSDAPLKYLSLSTKQYPEICEYPDSGKFMAWSWRGPENTLDILQRKGEMLDYWDGEP